MCPGFSRILEEGSDDVSKTNPPSNICLEDGTILNALKKGFKLETYRCSLAQTYCSVICTDWLTNFVWVFSYCIYHVILTAFLIRLRTSQGTEYEYTIENVNGLRTPADVNGTDLWKHRIVSTMQYYYGIDFRCFDRCENRYASSRSTFSRRKPVLIDIFKYTSVHIYCNIFRSQT